MLYLCSRGTHYLPFTFGIIVSFNVLEYRKLQLPQGMVIFAVGFFFFEILEEAFAAGIIKRITFL